jgi:N-acetylated-alpha-linked acidic dipeptidase
MDLDFSAAETAAKRFADAGEGIYRLQTSALDTAKVAALNTALRDAETALLNKDGLPHRAWYKHTIYDPGEYTGYAAVLIPGVTEGIDAGDAARTQEQIAVLARQLNLAASVLEGASK